MQLAHQELAARLTVEAVSLVIIMVIVSMRIIMVMVNLVIIMVMVSLVIIMVIVNLVMIMVMVNMRIIKVIHHGDRQYHGYGDGQDCDRDQMIIMMGIIQ